MVCAVPCQLCQLARIEEDASAPNADIYLDVPVATQRHEAIASWTWASVDVTRARGCFTGDGDLCQCQRQTRHPGAVATFAVVGSRRTRVAAHRATAGWTQRSLRS